MMDITPCPGMGPGVAAAAPEDDACAEPVRFSQALADLLCARVAAGESQLAICAEEGMPCRSTLWRWTLEHHEFGQAFRRARVAGGVDQANGRPCGYSDQVAAEIYARLCEGESMVSVCEDPAMPAMSTVYAWRRRFAAFDAALRTAREVQAERFCDLGWEIAKKVTPETAKATAVKLAHLRWTAAVLSPKQFGRLKPLEADVPAPVMQIALRTFKAEPDADGRMRVVSYTPNPETGRVERLVRGE
jgi:hypothetical protein